MISSLAPQKRGFILLILICVSVPGTGLSKTEKSASTHTERAHQINRSQVKQIIVPDVKHYQSMGSSLSRMLHFTTMAKKVADTLDGFRQHKSVRMAEKLNSVVHLITSSWDELMQLISETNAIRGHMTTLKQQASDLHTAANRYINSSNNDSFELLRGSFEDARPKLKTAQAAFARLKKLMGSGKRALEKLLAVLEGSTQNKLVKFWLGNQVAQFVQQLHLLKATIESSLHLMQMTHNAVDRDLKTIQKLTQRLIEAHAHDAYSRADALVTSSRYGSALSAFKKIRSQWPDTEWAHRSDRRIVEIEALIDAQQVKLENSMAELMSARQQLEQEKAKQRPAHDSTPVWAWITIIALSILSGSLFFSLRRQHRQA